jgi:hypothetical protein
MGWLVVIVLLIMAVGGIAAILYAAKLGSGYGWLFGLGMVAGLIGGAGTLYYVYEMLK